jgi:hypothetical protein
LLENFLTNQGRKWQAALLAVAAVALLMNLILGPSTRQERFQETESSLVGLAIGGMLGFAYQWATHWLRNGRRHCQATILFFSTASVLITAVGILNSGAKTPLAFGAVASAGWAIAALEIWRRYWARVDIARSAGA